MRDLSFWATVYAIIAFLPACDACLTSEQGDLTSAKQFNICLVLDGTDRLSEENGVPCITNDELVGIAETLSQKGTGSLYVSYVDNNCDNNRIAIFEWMENMPIAHVKKPDYMKMAEYKNLVFSDTENREAYDSRLALALGDFNRESNRIREFAYSDAVANQKKGSDVNGAINQACRLLRASESGAQESFIILVSDGCDNVGKKLEPLPHTTELIIVNTNVSKHQFNDAVSKEFVTLKQAVNYIFN